MPPALFACGAGAYSAGVQEVRSEAATESASEGPGGVGRHAAFGLAVSLGLAALYGLWVTVFAVEVFDPRGPFGLADYAYVSLVVTAMTGFLLATRRYDEARDDTGQLRSLTGLSPREFDELCAPAPRYSTGRLWLFRAVSMAVGLAIIPASASNPSFFFSREAFGPQLFWSVGANTLLFFIIGSTAFHSFASADLPRRISSRIAELDLLDAEQRAPFGRIGLRRAFYWVGGSTVASLLALGLERPFGLFLILGGTFAIATLSFLGPTLAIRERVALAKRSELDRVRARIRQARNVVLDVAQGQDEALRQALPGLLAYEARIEAVHEWPFDLGTVLRFAALLTIAAGSWLGGALVERLLGLALD